MVLYSLVAAITIFIACQIRYVGYGESIISRQRVLNCILMAAIFTILTCLAAFRLEVGNDYGTYVVTCHEIFQRGYVVTEPGYNLVVRILYFLSGKEDYLLMFAVFGAAIVFIFLKCFRELSDNFALSFFLFMALGIYFRSFNTVRYYFALAISLYSLKYVVDIGIQNLIKFFALIIFAACFHKSVLIVIPIYLFARAKWNKLFITLLIILATACILLREKLLEFALVLYPSYKNTVYIEESHSIMENLPIIFRCILVLILCMLCYEEAIKNNVANRTMFNLNILAIVLYLACFWLPLVTRIGYYLITPQILLVPNVLSLIKNDEKKRKLLYIVILVGIIYFVYFLFTAYNDGIRVLPYKTWLFYDHYWLNQTDTF